jgi:hypothetical protein
VLDCPAAMAFVTPPAAAQQHASRPAKARMNRRKKHTPQGIAC